jgi:hypothetical protein
MALALAMAAALAAPGGGPPEATPRPFPFTFSHPIRVTGGQQFTAPERTDPELQSDKEGTELTLDIDQDAVNLQYDPDPLRTAKWVTTTKRRALPSKIPVPPRKRNKISQGLVQLQDPWQRDDQRRYLASRILTHIHQIRLPDHPEVTASEISHALSPFWVLPWIPYVHPRVVSFRDDQHKAQWPSTKGHDTISMFLKTGHNDRQTWVAYFSTEAANWVGNKTHWDHLAWHAWAACICRDNNSKRHLILYDCDPRESTIQRPRINSILAGQKALVNAMRKENSGLTVWYNISKSKSGQNKCVAWAMARLKQWIQEGDTALQVPGDSRIEHCIELSP